MIIEGQRSAVILIALLFPPGMSRGPLGNRTLACQRPSTVWAEDKGRRRCGRTRTSGSKQKQDSDRYIFSKKQPQYY